MTPDRRGMFVLVQGRPEDAGEPGGVYVIFDRQLDVVRFVGRSRDIGKRLAWLQHRRGRYADRNRYFGKQIAASADYAVQRGVEQKAMDTYSDAAP
jgi:hypothetical protein